MRRIPLILVVIVVGAPQLGAAVLNLCGWESGGDREVAATAGTATVQSTTKRTGTYALQVNPAADATGYHQIEGFDTGGAAAGFNAATLYTRFYLWIATAPSSGDEPIFSAHTASLLKFELRLNSAGNLVAYNSVPTLLATGATVLSTGTWYRIEAQIGTGTTAAYTIYINGVSELTGTADTLTTNHNNLKLGKAADRNATNGSLDVVYDDLLVDSTTLPGAGQIVAMTPDADGNYVTWTIGAGSGSDFQQVDETPHDSDTTYLLSTLVAGEASTVALVSAATAGITGTVKAVKPVAVVKRTGGSNGTIQLRLRSGSTDSDGINVSSTSTYIARQLIHAVDPADAAAWTVADLDSIEVGLEERDAANATRWTYGAVMVEFAPAGGVVAPAALTTLGVGGRQ